MEKITLNSIPEDGLRLTHQFLFQASDDIIYRNDKDHIAQLLDGLKDSKVEAVLFPYDDRSGTYIRLRYGDIMSTVLSTSYLGGTFLDVVPFIAAIAGKSEEPTPSKLEELERRVARLENRTRKY